MRNKPSKRLITVLLLLTLGTWYYLSLPSPLFNASYSTVLLDREGKLLGARIATDGQWRFPLNDSVPEKLEQALLHKEDRHFYWHPGFNPVALVRALYLNLKHGEVKSGGSTITMQVVRLSKDNPPRTVWEKIKEIILATRIELSYSKEEILAMYASHAPFGGNVVGYEAAAWRYFNRAPQELSWAECATLAVLPNAPGMIHPGRNREQLREKRRQLLETLYQHEVIDQQTMKLALLEDIPNHPKPLPNEAPHLLTLVQKKQPGQRITTTLDRDWQQRAAQTLNHNLQRLRANHIKNGALLLIDNSSGEVLSYLGNASYDENLTGVFNDMIQTPRSPGSILKPFLYASMFSSGELLPRELVKDVPVFLGGYKPENYERTHDGAVPAGEALARSLNIPAVLLLRDYTTERFLKRLHELDFRHMNLGASHYGLSLILGGAEVTPWELGRAYYRLAASLNSYLESQGQENVAIPDLHFTGVAEEAPAPPIDQASIYQTFDILTTVNRPNSERGWKKFGHSNVAWKTGTSFGFRDAWAVGLSPKYTCVVWVGNADGEGRPGLIGVETAGPVLFDMMNQLPDIGWFAKPLNAMQELSICQKSGLKASPNCPDIQREMLAKNAQRGEVCTFHQKVFINREGMRVNRSCAAEEDMEAVARFVLPPVQAWYYGRNNADYQGFPHWKMDCSVAEEAVLDVIYPEHLSQVFIPREMSGRKGQVVLEVACQRPGEPVFWHINGQFVGQTQTFHKMGVQLTPGEYDLHVEDQRGNSSSRHFTVRYAP